MFHNNDKLNVSNPQSYLIIIYIRPEYWHTPIIIVPVIVNLLMLWALGYRNSLGLGMNSYSLTFGLLIIFSYIYCCWILLLFYYYLCILSFVLPDEDVALPSVFSHDSLSSWVIEVEKIGRLINRKPIFIHHLY